MKATIDPELLKEIHEATLLSGSAIDDNELLEIIGETGDPDAYRKAYEDYVRGLDKPAAAAKPATKQAKQAPAKAAAPVTPTQGEKAPSAKKIVLRNADGSTSDLELVKETGSAVFVKFPEPKPKDEVTVTLKGVPVVVDINELLGLPPSEIRHGFPVTTLLTIAAAAK